MKYYIYMTGVNTKYQNTKIEHKELMH